MRYENFCVKNVERTLAEVSNMTKFEKAKILGLRAKQLDQYGVQSLIEIDSNIIESHIIAEMELEAKVIPFIIQRPLPGGKKEYWKLSDLEFL